MFCGPDNLYRVLDARASAAADAPDIIQQVRILTISSPIPNDTLSFGPDFPADLRTQIEEALVAFAAECDDNNNCTTDICDPGVENGCSNEPVACLEDELCDPGTGACVGSQQ